MNRQHLEKYITDAFGVAPEYPWESAPSFAVFRHKHNRKWFAVIMDIPTEKLGLKPTGSVSVVNLKCDPLILGSMLQKDGFHKAYHMNKDHWLTARLDGSADADTLEWLLDISFELTNKKR